MSKNMFVYEVSIIVILIHLKLELVEPVQEKNKLLSS